jgi:hypothetical protein
MIVAVPGGRLDPSRHWAALPVLCAPAGSPNHPQPRSDWSGPVVGDVLGRHVPADFDPRCHARCAFSEAIGGWVAARVRRRESADQRIS